jgi:hypothetical protein
MSMTAGLCSACSALVSIPVRKRSRDRAGEMREKAAAKGMKMDFRLKNHPLLSFIGLLKWCQNQK